MQWDRAACRNYSAADFIPPDWDTDDPDVAAALDIGWYEDEGQAAIEVCRTCPVRVECFNMALDHESTIANGVWGGTTPEARARYIETLSV